MFQHLDIFLSFLELKYFYPYLKIQQSYHKQFHLPHECFLNKYPIQYSDQTFYIDESCIFPPSNLKNAALKAALKMPNHFGIS